MARYKETIFFIPLFITVCFCEISFEKKEKLLNGFIDYYNNLPNQIYSCEDGVLHNIQLIDPDCYKLEANLKISDLRNLDSVKHVTCTGTVQDLHDNGVTVLNNDHQCQDVESSGDNGGNIEEVVSETVAAITEPPFQRKPVQLYNEVQSSTDATSGEQFIAIPIERTKVHCIGCSSHVNPQAAGVNDLAALGVRQLNMNEPNVRHSLNSVVDVERQAQVVNGIRYIITFLVDYNSCTETETESCVSTKSCKVSILEKPWITFQDGSKYRAILSNNCTDEWLFGDDGIVLPHNPTNNIENNGNINESDSPGHSPSNSQGTDDVIKVIHNLDVQSQQNLQTVLTDEDVKKIEEQIIPNDKFLRTSTESTVTVLTDTSTITKQGDKVESVKYHSDNTIPTETKKTESSLTEDKKKTIDDMLNFFNFAGFDSKVDHEEEILRIKRSYATDLKVMSLTEKFDKIKKNIDNAKYVYTLAQTMVDYLNEIDMEVKNRVLKDVINAEEEFENYQHFFYIQARVVIPCEKADCDKDILIKICNAVIDNSNKENLHILNAFCYDDEQKKKPLGKVNSIPVNDPVLLYLVKESLKKIESDASNENAIKINKIIDATTQKVSGTLTKISLILEYLDCKKTVPYAMRTNCTVLEHLGSNVCEVVIHERHWLKERKITHSCTERPIEGTFSNTKQVKNNNVNSTTISNMLEEALQYLEVQSNRNNKQKIVAVNSISTQLIAGFLTDIEFVIGYTECTNNDDAVLSTCKLLENEPLRTCKAQIWDRTWIEDARQVDVSCKDPTNSNESNYVNKFRKRRSLGFVGGQKSKDVNDPTYKSLAEDSLQKFLQTSGDRQHYSLIKIKEVTVQVVSGQLTRVKFDISPTNCQVDAVGQPSSSMCEVLDPGDVINCDSLIWEQPWLGNKQINVTCYNENKNIRTKRQAGGVMEQDANDPRYQELAEESMQKFLQTSGNTQTHKIVTIDKVTTQVVAGSLTRIDFKISPTTQEAADVISCHSKVWEQPWLKKKDIDVDCQIDSQNNRAKRQLPGGVKGEDPNDPKYMALAEESMQKYLQTSGNTQTHKIVTIDKVTTQVVAGSLTRIDFKISPITQEAADVISCHSKVWERPWLKKKDIDVDCQIDSQNNRAKRQLLGGVKGEDPNDPKYIALAEESMQKYLQTSGNTQTHKIVTIDKVTTQVVAGSLTRIDFKISPITQEAADVISCHSKVWERPWLKKKDIDVDCQIDSQNNRAKRQLPGGVKGEDPNDPKYIALAEESMQKYLQTSGNTQTHKIVTIDKVTTQVVAGSLTRIDFKISPITQEAADVISCHSKVWERPWLKKKDIDVDCQIDSQNNRAKRQLPGGVKGEDPNDPKYIALAEESMQKYLQTSGNTQTHKIVTIDKVTTQVVAGSLTRIDFKISPITQEAADVISCHSKVWERPWLKKKDIDVDCQINGQNNRAKRQSTGGLKEADPNDPKYIALAEESLQKYLQTSGNTQAHKVIGVERVTVQLVAGTLTRIDFVGSPSDQYNGDVIKCKSNILEQFWLNKKEIDVNCNIMKQTSTRKNEDTRAVDHFREKRYVNSKRMLGSFQEHDRTNPKYISLAKDSLKKYQHLQNIKTLHKVVEVKRVRTKVVSGMIYEIDFTAAQPTCSTCPFLYCYAAIWDRPWLKRREIKVSCEEQEETVKKHLGGAKELDINNELYEVPRRLKFEERGKRQTDPDNDDDIDEDLLNYYADRAIRHINEVSESNNLHKLISIHAAHRSIQMDTQMIRLYIEIASTFCLRRADEGDLDNCEEMDGMNHRLCLARLWPSTDDELIVELVSVVCDDQENFASVTGLSIPILLRASIKELEKSPLFRYKLVHLGEPHLIPSLDSSVPIKMNFLVASTNCTKDMDPDTISLQCFVDTSLVAKSCISLIWMSPNSRSISAIKTDCKNTKRQKREISLDIANSTSDDLLIHKLVQESLEKLEMSSLHRYKQRLLQINSYSSQITTGKVTTIDFDVGYTSCLKYEWVENITSCEFLEHLPRRHCVSHVFERLWLTNGKNIEVNCEDDETPLEAHVEFESAESATKLGNEALKHIEAKYPNPRKQKVVRIFSLEKQVVAGIHYRMKVEIGLTDCTALSTETDCKLLKDVETRKFCRVNVWIRPWTDHPPNFRVTCDYQEGAAAGLYHRLQAEYLFTEFLTTYRPDYVNDHVEMLKRFGIFEANIRKIHEFNTHERGTARYAVTRFADLTYEEFSSKYLGLKPSLRDHNQVPMRKATIPTVEVPNKFDWRDHDAVTEVKDQGSCGSCWAFSVTGNIEGQWKMQSGELVSLSEQELVDCDKLDDGCNGGLPDNAYRAIEQLGGLEAENDYPYEGEDDKCAFNKTISKVQISGAVNISSNETEMAKWLVKNGPISIGINANAMQFYVGGVSHPWKMLCNPTNLDHGVLIVGYGVKDYPLFHKRLPYWIVKNSWGKTWGEQGYYRVYRGDGTCGVNQMASSAVI